MKISTSLFLTFQKSDVCVKRERVMEWLSELINTTMQEWNVPGLAIAIVKDNEILFSEGFGLRDVKKGLNVTSKTIFAIGSCTKAFTTMAMGILVDRGQLDWDKPVRNYLPRFKLYDAYATEHITPRDLVTHRSGLPRHDFVWYGTSLTRQQLVERLQYLEPTEELRSVFQYQNLMYMTAGYLVGQIAGSSWEEFVKQEIFNPLGMEDSNFSVIDVQKAADFAIPYIKKDDEIKQTPFLNQDAIGPAGSINSNVTDMAKWLLLHLNQSNYNTKRIISLANLSQMHTPQIVTPSPLEYPEILHSSYGLGWGITPYRGYNFIQHGGEIDGFSALTTLMPQDNIGIVILTNIDRTPLPSILTFQICDRLLSLTEVPWNERIKYKYTEAKKASEKLLDKISSDQKPGTQPSHFLEEYMGDFENPGYGILSVVIKDEYLVANYNSMEFELQHYHYDIFEMKSDLFEFYTLVSFVTDTQGDITSLSTSLEPIVKPIVFTRLPEKSMNEISFLEKFVGEYEVMGKFVNISLRRNQLIAFVVGQPIYELVPVKETEFILKGLPEFSFKFILDADGVAVSIEINQANGVFIAHKIKND